MLWTQLEVSMVILCAATVGVGCAGASFQVDAALAETPVLPVTGALGMNNLTCEGKPPRDRDARVTIGSFDGVFGAPHRSFSTTKLFGETAFQDYRRFLSLLPFAERTRRLDAEIEEVSLGGRFVGIPQIDTGLRGLAFVLALPGTATEKTTFTFLGKREDRVVMGACSTTDEARVFGALDGPRFSMTCRLTSTADHEPHELRVESSGSWTNFRFHGQLSGPNGERVTFASQNIEVAGMGMPRGFELRGTSGQVAAVSFWQVPRDTGPGREQYDPGAWVLADASDGWTDVMYGVLGLATAYPWPHQCDLGRLRSKAMDVIELP